MWSVGEGRPGEGGERGVEAVVPRHEGEELLVAAPLVPPLLRRRTHRSAAVWGLAGEETLEKKNIARNTSRLVKREGC